MMMMRSAEKASPSIQFALLAIIDLNDVFLAYSNNHSIQPNHFAAENGDDNITVRRDLCERAFLHLLLKSDQISFATHFFSFFHPPLLCLLGITQLACIPHISTPSSSNGDPMCGSFFFLWPFSRLPPCNKKTTKMKININKSADDCRGMVGKMRWVLIRAGRKAHDE